MPPPTIYKTNDDRKQALRDNALRCYYKKKGLIYEDEAEKKRIKKFIKKFLESDANNKIIYDFIQRII
jgi:hypothetical protein